MGMKNPGGEIVQVQGGHIVRSTGRKDRHSKVFTAKGPRDRRVRLSAHTAIQFYDVQDRLGYDRPSKAVDWLIKKAKSAIDKLAELPPWQPTDTAAGETPDAEPNPNMAGSGEMEAGIDPESSGYGFQALQRAQQLGGAGEASAEGYSIPESMKPFFPTSSENHQSSLNFQNYAQENPAATAADHLGLSLHSFHGGGADNAPQAEQTLFGFGSGNYQRIVAWQGHGHDGGGGEGRGFGFNNAASFSAAAQTQPQGLLGHHPATSLFNSTNQRGTLQSSSSFSQLVRAWDDLPSMAAASSSHRPQQQQQQQIHQPSIFGTRFVTDGGGGFPVFRIPARIHGEDGDQHDGEGGGHGVVSKRPSSSSSPNSAHH